MGRSYAHLTMPNTIIIDPEAIENLRALNPDDGDAFLRDIVGIFLEDTPQRLAELRQSLLSGDQITFIRAAHSIKGSASNLGASQLRAIAEKLEHHSKQSGLVAVEAMIVEIEEVFDGTRAELSRIISLT
jgi:histidine phosphotransfer protein HptB